ncbi:HpcH/HpaI aldolase family protein [Zhengella sp. ZM62]|uniref:HpcH/HpaI aldolase family protein n=1 Tax=Zhengella sedimenti TaxID=3390035 RepID=UPI0039766914
MILRNSIRRRIESGDVALGLIVRLVRSAEIAMICRATGHDFLFIDTQHAVFSRETIAAMITAARGQDVAALVRLRGYDDADASLFLDAGAAGLIVPDVNTAGQARQIVAAARFAPEGRRSLPGPLVQFDYQPRDAREAMDLVNADTLIVCMIETAEALANIEEIAAVPGVDVLHVGCVDLLLALGRPGEFGCPEILQAIDRVADAASRHGKVLGIGGDRDPRRRAGYVAQGARFLTTETDIGLLMGAAARAVADIRGSLDT